MSSFLDSVSLLSMKHLMPLNKFTPFSVFLRFILFLFERHRYSQKEGVRSFILIPPQQMATTVRAEAIQEPGGSVDFPFGYRGLIFGPSSAAFPGPNQGAVSEVEQSGHTLTHKWDAGPQVKVKHTMFHTSDTQLFNAVINTASCIVCKRCLHIL